MHLNSSKRNAVIRIVSAVCLILSFMPIELSAQPVSGIVTDKGSGRPVPYVNIGIAGRNIGTVSDSAGKFEIGLMGVFDGDSLYFSCIGYERRKYSINDIKASLSGTDQLLVELYPVVYPMKEVIVLPVKKEMRILGNYCDSNSTYGNSFISKDLGTEIGVVIRLPEGNMKAFLKEFRFYVGKFTFDEFPVRLNIYNLREDLPWENLLMEQILIKIDSPGEYIIDLERYSLIAEADFFVSLEYYKIPDISEGELVFCAVHNNEPYEGNGYYRLTSHGKWMREYSDNVGFSVRAECWER